MCTSLLVSCVAVCCVLQKETKQSAPKLKEVLNDIAEKVKQGRFKDMYQLRRDLQDTNE